MAAYKIPQITLPLFTNAWREWAGRCGQRRIFDLCRLFLPKHAKEMVPISSTLSSGRPFVSLNEILRVLAALMLPKHEKLRATRWKWFFMLGGFLGTAALIGQAFIACSIHR